MIDQNVNVKSQERFKGKNAFNVNEARVYICLITNV